MSVLTKKLLMKPGQQWLLLHAPQEYVHSLAPLPSSILLSFAPVVESVDGIQLFVKNSKDLADSLKEVQHLLQPEVVLWVIYPKKASGIDTDLNIMSSWDDLAKYGLGGVAAAAIDNNWTALRFRAQHLIRKDPTCNDEIGTSPYAAFIDVANRTVTLPENISEALARHPVALQFYQALSYTNKKEYVLWILTAKQEKTRKERLQKMVEKLLAGKKNPGEK